MLKTVDRAAVEAACMDRFASKPFDEANRHCGHLAAHAMHKAGHRAGLLNQCKAKTMRGAWSYIRKAGFGSLIDLMDATGLPRIVPAEALPGDIIGIAVADDDAFRCSLSVALSNGNVLGCNPVTGLIEPCTVGLFAKDGDGIPVAWRI